MADQPVPDFSQNQQFAPGFQPQMPIPGISSSYQQQQQQFQPSYQPNQFIAQQANMIAIQGMNNNQSTMVLAQQNLMYSMHNALLGTMNAFTDVSRRSGNMINHISAAGTYNDMLAPNQNWALESSFRREMGFHMMRGVNSDPYNSTWSRLIQGRRPEFLTEGEYSSSMGYASKLRGMQFEKGIASIGMTAALGWGVGTLGLGLAPAMAIPMIGGLAFDRHLEAQHAEHEDLLRQQMYVKNKRVGIGQQFISTSAMADVHGSFYKQDNPYWSRFFGDTAVGRAFKPDVEKLKMFNQASESGLLAFENLDVDSLIKKINEISNTVEKFSRIGKVTREASIKMMGELKGAGIHGSDTASAYMSAAHTSSLTGIDMPTIVGLKSRVSAAGNAMGYDGYSSAQTYETVLSGFAMMQSRGLFQKQDIMRMTNNVYQGNNYSGRPGQDVEEGIDRYGGDFDAYKRNIIALGGNASSAVGMIQAGLITYPMVTKVNAKVDNALKKHPNATWTQLINSDPVLGQWMASDQTTRSEKLTAHARYYGLDEVSLQDELRSQMRHAGHELDSTSVNELGDLRHVDPITHSVFSRDNFSRYRENHNLLYFEFVDDDKFQGVRKELKKYGGNMSPEQAREALIYIKEQLPITSDKRFADDSLRKHLIRNNAGMNTGGPHYIDANLVALDLMREANSKASFMNLKNNAYNEEAGLSILGGMIRNLDASGVSPIGGEEGAAALLSAIKGKGIDIRDDIKALYDSKYSNGTFDVKKQHAFMKDFKDLLVSKGIDPSTIEEFKRIDFFGNNQGQAAAGGYNNPKQGQVIAAMINSLVADEIASTGSVYDFVARKAAHYGMKPSEFQQKARILGPMYDKYIDSKTGELKEGNFEISPDSGKPTDRVNQEAKTALREQLIRARDDKKAHKILVEELGGGNDAKAISLGETKLKRAIDNLLPGDKGGDAAITKEFYEQYTKPLTRLNDDIDASTAAQVAKSVKTAMDPSGAAVDTLNQLLTRVYNVMVGDVKANTPNADGKVFPSTGKK